MVLDKYRDPNLMEILVVMSFKFRKKEAMVKDSSKSKCNFKDREQFGRISGNT